DLRGWLSSQRRVRRMLLYLHRNGFLIQLSIVLFSTSLTTEASLVIPPNAIPSSTITSHHYIAVSTPTTIHLYSTTLTPISTTPLPFPVFTGSARWLIYPTTRGNTTLPRSPILNTPPESRLVERLARGLTKELASYARETSEKAFDVVTSYFSGTQTTPEKKTVPTGRPAQSCTLVVYDVPSKEVVTQFQVPYKVGYVSLSPSGTTLFCAPPKGDEFFVYSLAQIPTAVHLLATFSRGYTYSRVTEVTWRADSGVLGVISAHGTGHVFTLKRRGRESARAIGKVKIEGGVKGITFLSKEQKHRRRSSMSDERPD